MKFTDAKTRTMRIIALSACVAVLSCWPGQDAQAQQRYAAFIHGFSFGGGECNRSAQGGRWISSGTPQSWTGGAIDGYVVLKYCDENLYQNTNAVLDRLAGDMDPSSARWVLVGHSQGGIVARLLHQRIKNYHTGINVEGVMAIASPMQGARPAGVAYGKYYDGYKNIKPTLDDALADITDGPITESETGILNILTLGTAGQTFSGKIENKLHEKEAELKLTINASTVEKNAKANIGVGGDLITRINNAPDPDQYRALLGAERAPISARIGAGFPRKEISGNFDFVGLPRFWSPLGTFVASGLLTATDYAGLANLALFVEEKDGKVLDPGDEAAAADLFYGLTDVYADNADYHKWRRWSGVTCVTGDCARYKAWKRGREALQGFGQTHGELIDAFRLKKKPGERTICPDGSGGTVGGRTAQAKFEPPTADEWVDYKLEPPDGDGGGPGPGQDDDDGASGNECWIDHYTYWVTVPNKNDGLLGVNYTTWDSDHNGPKKGRLYLGDHSFFYSDRPKRM